MMPANLDWQAEDDKGWGDPSPEREDEPRDRRFRRRALVLVLALTLAAGAAALVVFGAGRLLGGGTNQVEAELMDGHRLVLEAAAKGDGDLLAGLIYDRLPEWTESQKAAANAGLLLERKPLDLSLAGGQDPGSIEVQLAPDLRQALVTTTLSYQVGSNGDDLDVIELSHVYAYRRQDNRWQLSPHTGAFWGSWQPISGRYLTLNYPERDAQLAQRLAADLESTIGQACFAVSEIDCPEEMHFVVNLVTDPAVLVTLSDPNWPIIGGRTLELPAPTLLGQPANEAAYRAFYRAYAQQVVSRLLADRLDLGDGSPLQTTLANIDRLLNRLGLHE